MKIRLSYVLALALAGGTAYYMLTGKTIVGGQPDNQPASIAERNGGEEAQLFRVQVETHEAMERSATLEIRGRTEADSLVAVRAQTGGILETRPVAKGDRVAAGDLLCVIERGARQARLAQAKAQLVQAQTDLEARQRLAEGGHVARNLIPAFQAAADAAKAAVADAELELARTEVRAPIAGVIQDPLAEVGDVVAVGGTCATLIDSDPMTVTGQVSEREIGLLSVGMTAEISFISGEKRSGTVRYIAPSADAETRTFRVDINVENEDGAIRDGVTALASVPLAPTRAHLVSSAYLTLDDAGTVGVRVVEDENLVAFVPLTIIGASEDGIWVTGLSDKADIITVGQDYVVAGETVEPVSNTDAPLRPRRTAELAQ